MSQLLPSMRSRFPLLFQISQFPIFVFSHSLILSVTSYYSSHSSSPFLPSLFPLFFDFSQQLLVLSSYAIISPCAILLTFLLSLSIPCVLSLHPLRPHVPTLTSLQSPGVEGPPLPRSTPAGLCQLAAGPLPALHLHHRLLQHLEGSQDVWKGN